MSYTELKELPALEGSLNIYVSQSHSLRRPPSLSESHAFTPENVQRAYKLLEAENAENAVTTEHKEIVVQPRCLERYERPIILYTLRFTFHIALISIFESIFFFFYVSTLEDGGITNTVNYFITDAVQACSNWTPWEQSVVNDILVSWINVTTIANTANSVATRRIVSNARLMRISWIYVGSFAFLFGVSAIYAHRRKINVHWGRLILENFAMVLMLALYEFLFFTTIITPYSPLSAQEIELNAIRRFQGSCNLF